jgi:hypothetical protein
MNESELSQFGQGKLWGEVLAKLEIISTKLDVLAATDKELQVQINEHRAQLVARIEVLEQWKSWLMGASAVIGVVSGAIGGKIINLINK